MAIPVFIAMGAAGALVGSGELLSNLGTGQGLLRNLNQIAGKIGCATQEIGGTAAPYCTLNQTPGHENDAYPNAPFSGLPQFL